jgi:hypothetical protein
MELDWGTCQVCRYPIQRLQHAGASWYHIIPADSTACPAQAALVPLENDGQGVCGVCDMTAHPGADCPMVAGQ